MSTTNSTAAKVPTVAISMCALARRIAATNRVPLEVAQRMTEGIRARARAEGGRVQRKGLAALETIADGPGTGKKLQEASNEELAALAGAAFGPGRAR